MSKEGAFKKIVLYSNGVFKQYLYGIYMDVVIIVGTVEMWITLSDPYLWDTAIASTQRSGIFPVSC